MEEAVENQEEVEGEDPLLSEPVGQGIRYVHHAALTRAVARQLRRELARRSLDPDDAQGHGDRRVLEGPELDLVRVADVEMEPLGHNEPQGRFVLRVRVRHASGKHLVPVDARAEPRTVGDDLQRAVLGAQVMLARSEGDIRQSRDLVEIERRK